MNFVFLSPNFPPHYGHFVQALRERGITVLGVGDVPFDCLSESLRASLREYYRVDSLSDLDALTRAVGYFTWRYGRIDRIESLNETWLAIEAQLRELFHVEGLQPAEVGRLRSKRGMGEIFREAQVPYPEVSAVDSAEQLKSFAKRVGYPLVVKPDVGVGAAHTFSVRSDADVDAAFASPKPGAVAQPYINGVITTFDGFVDRDGKLLFHLSHEYSDGVMEVVSEGRDISFWSLKEVPPELERLGRKALDACKIRERWFHFEFFRMPDGHFVALEVNLRPPGGFMTDMMNFACDIDVYKLWARMVSGESVKDFQYSARYHVCHTARRKTRPYRHSHQEITQRLGARLLVHEELPVVYQSAMGTDMYLTRHETLSEMKDTIRYIQATRS